MLVEHFPLEHASEAYRLLHDGTIQGRAVIVPNGSRLSRSSAPGISRSGARRRRKACEPSTGRPAGGPNLIPFAGIFLWFMGAVRDYFGEAEDKFFAIHFLGGGCSS